MTDALVAYLRDGGSAMSLDLHSQAKHELIHDSWLSGEHTGTFRGNNHAMLTATVALRKFWTDDALSTQINMRGNILAQALLTTPDALLHEGLERLSHAVLSALG
ncbi:hypothetical protein NRY95_11170 [Xanthomonas campestris pv. phormiicola]|nr:hypothetical protein [Xanthomonas campestris pv. phormiicola]UYC14323.1 hypothetical protein NRY95_11170 [Xanthomonas campestris pv. phormiicola]